MNKFQLITGSDDVAIKYKASKIIEELKEKQDNILSIETINCEVEKGSPETALREILISINTPSFFTSSKIIWAKHCDFLGKKTKDDKQKKDEEKELPGNIGSLVDKITESLEMEVQEQTGLSFLLDAPGLKAKSPLYKFFKKNGEIIELNTISSTDKEYQGKLIEKIKEYCLQEKKNISFKAIQFLTETIGSDSAKIYNELNKIIAYAGNKDAIDIEDCKPVASKSIETSNWIFADAVASRDLRASFETLNQVIDREMSEKSASSNIELTMLFGVISKFTQLVNVKANAIKLGIKQGCNYPYFKSMIEKNEDPDNKLASIHPYRAFKLFEESLRFSDKDFAEIFSSLLDANKEMVSGNPNSRIVLENLIVRICRKKSEVTSDFCAGNKNSER